MQVGWNPNGNVCTYNCVGWVFYHYTLDEWVLMSLHMNGRNHFVQQQLIHIYYIAIHANKFVMRKWWMALMRFDSSTLIKFQWTRDDMNVISHGNFGVCTSIFALGASDDLIQLEFISIRWSFFWAKFDLQVLLLGISKIPLWIFAGKPLQNVWHWFYFIYAHKWSIFDEIE